MLQPFNSPVNCVLFLDRLARTNCLPWFSLPLMTTRVCLWGGDHSWMSSVGVFSLSRPPRHALLFCLFRWCESDSIEPSNLSLRRDNSWSGLKQKKRSWLDLKHIHAYIMGCMHCAWTISKCEINMQRMIWVYESQRDARHNVAANFSKLVRSRGPWHNMEKEGECKYISVLE